MNSSNNHLLGRSTHQFVLLGNFVDGPLHLAIETT